jgi:hypothetical protein
MLYLLDFYFFLINIDQETVLNWFGIDDPNVIGFYQLNQL